MLHIISKNLPANSSLLALLGQSEQPQTLLFYGEGCYNLAFDNIQTLAQKHQLFVLETDLKARGLTPGCAQAITMAEFVNNVFSATNNASWY